MRELDEQSQDKQKDLHERLESYISEWNSGHIKRDEETEKSLRETQQNVLELADEKVEIAVQTYDIVDRHIRRLDQDLRDFELLLTREKEKMVGGAIVATPGPAIRPSLSSIDVDETATSVVAAATTAVTSALPTILTTSAATAPLSGTAAVSDGNNTPRKGAGKGLATSHKRTASMAFGSPNAFVPAPTTSTPMMITSPTLSSSTTTSTPKQPRKLVAASPLGTSPQTTATTTAIFPSVLARPSALTSATPGFPSLDARVASIEMTDMPVHPSEPVYCFCKRVSFGQMVACDNPDCPREWFHFECVGLTQAPKGKWYCPDCANLMRKKKATG